MRTDLVLFERVECRPDHIRLDFDDPDVARRVDLVRIVAGMKRPAVEHRYVVHVSSYLTASAVSEASLSAALSAGFWQGPFAALRVTGGILSFKKYSLMRPGGAMSRLDRMKPRGTRSKVQLTLSTRFI